MKYDDNKFDFNRTWYLAGPMTGYPNYNYDTFETVAADLRMEGVRLVAPHEAAPQKKNENLPPEDLWEVMMRITWKCLQTCDGIITLKGWPQSKGACIEVQHAMTMNWPIWYYDSLNKVLINMNKD